LCESWFTSLDGALRQNGASGGIKGGGKGELIDIEKGGSVQRRTQLLLSGGGGRVMVPRGEGELERLREMQLLVGLGPDGGGGGIHIERGANKRRDRRRRKSDGFLGGLV